MYICIYVYMYICIYVYMYICIYVSLSLSLSIYIYIYIYTHVMRRAPALRGGGHGERPERRREHRGGGARAAVSGRTLRGRVRGRAGVIIMQRVHDRGEEEEVAFEVLRLGVAPACSILSAVGGLCCRYVVLSPRLGRGSNDLRKDVCSNYLLQHE